ncbi:hypothetical protein L249_1361 [Ophiocordyceps polyrhachis-furcata BCC 54312]|uniref:Uncharacterized protein n=1 Tax=Ophiocordyceps polyrhachis-furcata BCC 54312 TaxID=1330021 RepID=A0A367KYR7_9HYPO|nr:hypothetical protein L249_1361 [Ophiocordyceps polyrhachis-furcata BCC 54312]
MSFGEPVSLASERRAYGSRTVVLPPTPFPSLLRLSFSLDDESLVLFIRFSRPRRAISASGLDGKMRRGVSVRADKGPPFPTQQMFVLGTAVPVVWHGAHR